MPNRIFFYRHRVFFTLIEMMVVIGILVIFTGVIGINVAKAIREQQFNTEVGLIVERLRFAQNMMLVMNQDVKVKVKSLRNEQGLELNLDVEGGVSKEWQFVIDRSKLLLTNIHYFQFDDLLNYPQNPKEVEIKFLSGGSVMSRGVIHLSTHENPKDSGAMNSAILLYGYPHPISSVDEIDNPVVLIDEDRDYDTRLTNYTVEELKQYEAMQQSQKKTKDAEKPKSEGNVKPEEIKLPQGWQEAHPTT
jgi:competence protein ComGC